MLLAHKLPGYGLAIMTNTDRGGAFIQELSQRIQNAYAWDSLAEPAPRGYDPPPDHEAIELPADVLAEYVGEYRLEEATIVIGLENGAAVEKP